MDPKPIDWLSKDVREMSDSETACEYCGISYLLLNKYERLEKEMAEMKLERHRLSKYIEERPKIMEHIEMISKSQASMHRDKLEMEALIAELKSVRDALQCRVKDDYAKISSLESEIVC